MRGGMEAIYDDMPGEIGFAAFAPRHEARGSKFAARRRLERAGDTPTQPEGVSEGDMY